MKAKTINLSLKITLPFFIGYIIFYTVFTLFYPQFRDIMNTLMIIIIVSFIGLLFIFLIFTEIEFRKINKELDDLWEKIKEELKEVN